MNDSTQSDPDAQAPDWPALLDAMVERLKAEGHLRDDRVETALRAVPRHEFLEDIDLEDVYSGGLIRTLADDQGNTLSTASQIFIVVAMLEQLAPRPGNRVLEVGLGTGYNTALLAHLAHPGNVTSIDVEPILIARARANFKRLGISNVEAVVGDGWDGHAANAPYDAILATVGISDVPPHWIAQLRDGGRLIAPVWFSATAPLAVELTKHGDRLVGGPFSPARFLMLGGAHAAEGGYAYVDEELFYLRDESPETVITLQALLASHPVESGPVPADLDNTWTLSLGLEDPNTIASSDRRFGLFDPDLPGLALVDMVKRTVHGYGDAALLERLKDHLRHVRPIPLRDATTGRKVPNLRIDAAPHGTNARPEGGWLVDRPNYDFLIQIAEE